MVQVNSSSVYINYRMMRQRSVQNWPLIVESVEEC